MRWSADALLSLISFWRFASTTLDALRSNDVQLKHSLIAYFILNAWLFLALSMLPSSSSNTHTDKFGIHLLWQKSKVQSRWKSYRARMQLFLLQKKREKETHLACALQLFLYECACVLIHVFGA